MSENNKFDKQKYDKQYIKEHYDRIEMQVDKDKQIKERLKVLSIGTNKSMNQLLIEAIEDLLNKYNAWLVAIHCILYYVSIYNDNKTLHNVDKMILYRSFCKRKQL